MAIRTPHQQLDNFCRKKRDVALTWALDYLRRSGDAEDAVAEAFAVAATRLEKYDAGRSFDNWLRGIVRYVCMNLNSAKGDAALCGTLTAPDPIAEVMAAAARAHTLSEIYREMRKLPQAQRDLLLDVYIKGVSAKSAAENAGESTHAVAMRLLRARRKVAAGLSDTACALA